MGRGVCAQRYEASTLKVHTTPRLPRNVIPSRGDSRYPPQALFFCCIISLQEASKVLSKPSAAHRRPYLMPSMR